MNQFKSLNADRLLKGVQRSGLAVISMAALLAVALPAMAHHPMGNKLPANFFEGFASGLGHPVIGLDHVAFIVATGFLAATRKQGILIPIAFVLTAVAGTGLHLSRLDLPGVELLVSGSILLFGILLAMRHSLNLGAIAGLAGIAGLFHGYAYGESIVGAEMTPLMAYLAGFTVIQLAISLVAFWIGRSVLLGRDKSSDSQPNTARLSSAGLVLSGIGLAFFASKLLETMFSAPSA
jgi:urease accessory protein